MHRVPSPEEDKVAGFELEAAHGLVPVEYSADPFLAEFTGVGIADRGDVLELAAALRSLLRSSLSSRWCR